MQKKLKLYPTFLTKHIPADRRLHNVPLNKVSIHGEFTTPDMANPFE